MRHAPTITAPPTDQPSNKSTLVLLAIAVLVLVGLVYKMVVRDQPVDCPIELVGAWHTSAKGYEESMLVFTKSGVAFSVGAEHVDGQALRRLEVTPDGPRTLYTVIYGDSRRDEQTLSLYYHQKDQTITFKNQLHLVWTRKAAES